MFQVRDCGFTFDSLYLRRREKRKVDSVFTGDMYTASSREYVYGLGKRVCINHPAGRFYGHFEVRAADNDDTNLIARPAIQGSHAT